MEREIRPSVVDLFSRQACNSMTNESCRPIHRTSSGASLTYADKTSDMRYLTERQRLEMVMDGASR
jgi:hypothetical protein